MSEPANPAISPTPPAPALYLLPVPLSDGAPADCCITAYERRVIAGLRHFIVENVRSARRFLRKVDPGFPIDESSFTVLDEHSRTADVPAMLEPLSRGIAMGIISEAGCPAVADPGADAVAVAQARGYRVVPLVGPSSILLALMGSGFNGQSFAFAGYLPVDAAARQKRLREMEGRVRREHQTQIFIETPYRNNRLIGELTKSLPATMKLCVASDVTGPRESITTRTLGRWAKSAYDYDKIPTIFLIGE